MSLEGGALPKTSDLTAMPTGEVTFLFSDIEGSTQRWDAHAEAMKSAVARHEQLMGGAIARHAGYVFKSMGDSFCVAFHSAPDAVAAAVDAQLALKQEDFSSVDGLRVRMGLHTGHAEERNADYFGPTVNRVARLMAIGHGGQILVSGAVADALHDARPSVATLIDLGLRRLKDLTQPERVWQLAIAGLATDFPPLNSLDARANNLPVQVSSLLGREQDVEHAKSLMAQHRMLTLFGAGGIGKTRLALQVGADLLDRYPDGVWFGDLAPISDPELVASVVANVIGMPQRGGQRVSEGIPQWLKRKNLLLILDNCEHVLETVASLADNILAGAPDVRILATSRQALGIGGEVVHRLPSLAVPNDVDNVNALEAMQYGAVALFVDRASATDTRFVLTDDTAPIAAEICRRLDGIPLAIELAAARVKVLSIPNIARRLNDRFKVLTGGSRTALPRQKTLIALIDWSYDLLTPQEQELFNRVGVFAGSFSLDAATAICTSESIDEIATLDLLSSLAEKSLIVADTAGKHERFRLLESTRAYALDKLTAAGERERLAGRHAEFFRDRANEADQSYGTGSAFAWFDNAELELDNYRAALDWGLSQGHDPVLGAAIAGALGQLWFRGGLIAEGRYWIEPAVERIDAAEHPRIAARLWHALASIYSAKRMCAAAEKAAGLYESAGDRRGAAVALSHVAFGLFQMGRVDDAYETNTRALATMRDLADDRGVANCLLRQGSIARRREQIAEARDSFAQALSLFKAFGNEMATAGVLTNLAELEFADGHPNEALRLQNEAMAINKLRGTDALSIAIEHANSAAYRIALGDLVGARVSARAGLRFGRLSQDAFIVAIALQHWALVTALDGQIPSAARLLGYVETQFKKLEYIRESTEEWAFEKLVALLREHLSDAEIEKFAIEGGAWSEDRAVEEAQERP